MTKIQNNEGFRFVEKQNHERLVSVFVITPARNNGVKVDKGKLG